MKIEQGRRVRVRVMLKVVDGDVLEKSAVEYVQGGGTMLKGVEEVLEGCEAGDKREGVLQSKDAFGNEDNLPTKSIKRSDFPKDAKLTEGEIFMAKSPDGQDVNFRIMKIDEENETVDVRFLHPLAGKDIEYELEVVSVTDPEPPPLPSDLVADDEAED